MKGGCIPSKNKFETQKKNNKLRWCASDIDFKRLHIGCPVTHDQIRLSSVYTKPFHFISNWPPVYTRTQQSDMLYTIFAFSN